MAFSSQPHRPDVIRYFFWMLFASGLGFLKVMALAQIMTPANLGSYVSIAGVAVLSGTLLSFGQIEGTTKYYPRLWLAGDHARIISSVRIIALKLGLRFLAGASLALVALWFTALENPFLTVLAAAGIGLCSAYLSLAASLLRAAEDASALQAFNLVRNGSAIILSCSAGWMFGWQGALMGDLIAAAASLAHVAYSLRRIFATQRNQPNPAASTADEVQKTGGGKLYVAYLLSSSTQLLDRGAINIALGAAAAGSYGVIALMFQVGQLVVNIFTQRAGPRVIKSAQAAGKSGGRIESVRKPIYGMLSLTVAITGAALLVMWLDLPNEFFSKYEISWELILLGGGVCFMQIFSLFEFHLIAHDSESEVLLASAISTGLLVSLFGAAWLLMLPLEWFVASVLVARTVHATLLWRLMNVGHSRPS
jgi:O-antigen/teichoic acid export membrane protein